MGPEAKIAEVDNFTYQALRRYWAEYDFLKDGRSQIYPYIWDLRSGLVSRWPDDIGKLLHPPLRNIHYTLHFRRGDGIDEFEYLEEHGEFPPPPDTWNIVWGEGTFQGDDNPKHIAWFERAQEYVHGSEEDFNEWIAGDPAPPEWLPHEENWPPERALEELTELVPEAQRALVEDDPRGLEWGVRKFIITDEPDDRDEG